MARKDRGFIERKIYISPKVWKIILRLGNASEFVRVAVDEKIAREGLGVPDIGTEEADDDN